MNSPRIRATIALVLFFALTGCGSINATMQSWQGKPAHNLIMKWGPPTRTITDGAGGQVLTYDYWVPRTFIPYLGWIGGYTATRSFYVNAEGVIYNWRWQGL